MTEYLAGIFSVPTYESDSYDDLPFCSNDCVELKKVLLNNLGMNSENIKSLGSEQNEKVMSKDIIKKIKSLCKRCQTDNILFLYFSGHGHSENNEGYLISYDTDTEVVPHSSLPISVIKDELDKCEAKIKILIIDSCYSGFGRGKNTEHLMSNDFETSIFSNISEGTVIFASCKQNELSYALEDNSMSIFTHYLIEGLKGHAVLNENSELDINDLYSYVTGKVTKWVFDKEVTQTPNLETKYAGKLLLKIVNSETNNDDTDSNNDFDVSKSVSRIELTSTYVSPSSEMIFDESDYPPIPTGEYRTLPYKEQEELAHHHKKQFIGNFLASFIKLYKPNDVKIIDENTYELPFGKLINLSNKSSMIEFKLIVSDKLDTEQVKSFLDTIDDQKIFSWDSLEYIFQGTFDLNKVHNIALEKNYTVEFYLMDKDSSAITFSKNQEEITFVKKSSWEITLSNNSNSATLKIFQQNKLMAEFFQTLPIEDLVNVFSETLFLE